MDRLDGVQQIEDGPLVLSQIPKVRGRGAGGRRADRDPVERRQLFEDIFNVLNKFRAMLNKSMATC